ncbi:sigma-70 family RNA polymerase sigma factor [Crocinitomicaceae bacterium]|nr:sigma-70 family RNA polymerase sigma factor [Crocinitomicaceae bacterium]
MHLDDQSILEAISRNTDRGYHHLVDAYADRVFSTCLNLTRNQEDAEDVTQEVFTTIYLSLDNFEGNSKLSTWIYSIATNKCKEFLRRKTRKKRSGYHTELEQEDSHFVPLQIIDFQHPGVVMEDKERAKVLFSAIEQLAENQSLAYTLHKIEGRSYQEVAEMMEVSVSSVESLLFRAKKRLQQLLENYYRENLE